jgi:hypothetical protein
MCRYGDSGSGARRCAHSCNLRARANPKASFLFATPCSPMLAGRCSICGEGEES